MSEPIDIDLRFLVNAVQTLVEHAERINGSAVVTVPQDMYWTINDRSTKFDPYADQDQLHPGVGSLKDDLVELRSVLAGEKTPHTYALVWVAALLEAVGHAVPG